MESIECCRTCQLLGKSNIALRVCIRQENKRVTSCSLGVRLIFQESLILKEFLGKTSVVPS